MLKTTENKIRNNLERTASVSARKADQRLFHTASDGEYLEQFPHFRGRQQLLRRGGGRKVALCVRRVGFAQQVGDAAIDEELGLAGVAQHRKARLGGGPRERAEIDM